MDLHSSFFIQVYIDGTQIPLMHLECNGIKEIKQVEHLSRGHLAKSEGVKKVLEELGKVLDGNIKDYSFGGDDWCIVDFKKGKSTIINGFDEFEAFEIDSQMIFNLLEDWYKFLLAYENGEIPGLLSRSVD